MMKTAIVFNTKSGFSKEMDAAEFEREYVGNPDLGIEPKHGDDLDALSVVSKDDALPLTFRKSHYRMGRTEFVNACWVRPDGFGDQDHFFDHGQQQNLEDAVKSGKSVLLSLNLDLSPRPVSFEDMQENGAQKLDNWIGENRGNFITVSIKSVEQAVKAIKKVHELGADPNKSVFALHRGAVVPHRNFYLGDNRKKMENLHNNMQQGFSGVALGETRMIGFPRLICFVPTDKTVETAGAKGMKGNHLKADSGKPYVSNLIVANREEVLDSDPYKILEQQIGEGKPEYVLACPGAIIGADNNVQEGWKILHWVIKDVDAQVMPLDEDAQKKLLEHVERLNYSCRRVKEMLQLSLFDGNENEPNAPEI